MVSVQTSSVFRQSSPSDYDWANLLSHAAEYAARLDLDWVIHYDADEIRCAPWPSTTLVDAISFVDSLGYSAIDFTVLNFLFTTADRQTSFAPETSLFFDFGRHPAHLTQVKAWKNQGQEVDLVNSGGHFSDFDGVKVYPVKFLTKHYPLRSVEQSNVKIFRDRIPRAKRESQERRWHTHYNIYKQVTRIEPWRRHELLNFDPIVFGIEYLLERLSGIGIELDETGEGHLSINTTAQLQRTFEFSEFNLRRQVVNAVGAADRAEERAIALQRSAAESERACAAARAKLDEAHAQIAKLRSGFEEARTNWVTKLRRKTRPLRYALSGKHRDLNLNSESPAGRTNEPATALEITNTKTPIGSGGEPFKVVQGACTKKVIVLSAPKAGTYLMGRILEVSRFDRSRDLFGDEFADRLPV